MKEWLIFRFSYTSKSHSGPSDSPSPADGAGPGLNALLPDSPSLLKGPGPIGSSAAHTALTQNTVMVNTEAIKIMLSSFFISITIKNITNSSIKGTLWNKRSKKWNTYFHKNSTPKKCNLGIYCRVISSLFSYLNSIDFTKTPILINKA